MLHESCLRYQTSQTCLMMSAFASHPETAKGAVSSAKGTLQDKQGTHLWHGSRTLQCTAPADNAEAASCATLWWDCMWLDVCLRTRPDRLLRGSFSFFHLFTYEVHAGSCMHTGGRHPAHRQQRLGQGLQSRDQGCQCSPAEVGTQGKQQDVDCSALKRSALLRVSRQQAVLSM